MKKPIISIIAAHDSNLGIGCNNDLPWHISKDLQHFKKITLGKPVIMGRNTYDSIMSRLEKPLPNRLNIVITSHKLTPQDSVMVVGSLNEAIRVAAEKNNDEVFIIGGAHLYETALPLTDKLYITEIDKIFTCDTFFPQYENDFSVFSRVEDSENGLNYAWLELVRT